MEDKLKNLMHRLCSSTSVCPSLPCCLMGFDPLSPSYQQQPLISTIIARDEDRMRKWYIVETHPNSLLWVAMAIDGHNCVSIVGGNSYR